MTCWKKLRGIVRCKAALVVGCILLGEASLLGAVTPEELVQEVQAALDARDKVAFRKCFNFDGLDEKSREVFDTIEKDIFLWPTHYVSGKQRLDDGKARAVEGGKTYTFNGEWLFFLDVNLAEPPSKGLVFPAGLVHGRYLILSRVEEKP